MCVCMPVILCVLAKLNPSKKLQQSSVAQILDIAFYNPSLLALKVITHISQHTHTHTQSCQQLLSHPGVIR